MKFYIETFGCQMNVADSSEMGRVLVKRGFEHTVERDKASWILINTCTVRDHAEAKALSFLGRLREWRKADPSRRILLTGCAAERLQTGWRHRFPYVDWVVGARDISRFDRMVFGSPLDEAEDWPSGAVSSFLPQEAVTAHVTIMRGCNYSCTYCIVPQVRGPEVYRPLASILEEVEHKVGEGKPEVLLLGQTVNSYRPAGDGKETPPDFAELLQRINDVPGVKRIRFMSPHPRHMTERCIHAIGTLEHVSPHVHLPVQSGSTTLLKKMRRNYTRQDFISIAEKLRRARPGLEITTDFIVGFPGETEADFQDTLSLIRETDLEGAFCFKYSPRPHTDAALYPDAVSEAEKEDRLRRLLDVTNTQGLKKVQRFKESTQQVLVEKMDTLEGQTRYEGRNPSFWKIGFTSEFPLQLGQEVPVRVTNIRQRTLEGAALYV